MATGPEAQVAAWAGPVSQHHADAFRVKRVSLVANMLTAQYAPMTAKAVSIGNATANDVQVHTHADESEYLVVAAGYERLIPVDLHLFTSEHVAFWLKALASGTVVLLWY